MKKSKLFAFATLLICGALFADYEEFDYLYEDQKTIEPQEPRDRTASQNEPAIQGLSLSRTLQLENQSIHLNQHFSPNPEIITDAGIQIFFPENDGVLVKKSGLYRVSFFQRVHSSQTLSRFVVFLLRTPGNYTKRYQVVEVDPGKSGEIRFMQILRINAGEKIALILRPFGGKTTLHSGFSSSGFTIEAISN